MNNNPLTDEELADLGINCKYDDTGNLSECISDWDAIKSHRGLTFVVFSNHRPTRAQLMEQIAIEARKRVMDEMAELFSSLKRMMERREMPDILC